MSRIETDEAGMPSQSDIRDGEGTVAEEVHSSERPSQQTPQQYSGLARIEVLRKLKREIVRFRTFQTWRSQAVQPNALARAGFFYFNDGDKVQCAFCLGIVEQWVSSDDPQSEHRRHFPRCPFVLGLPVGNISIDPISGRERTETQFDPPNPATVLRVEVRLNARPDNERFGLNSHSQEKTDDLSEILQKDFGVELLGKPAKEEFATFETRLTTFSTWPRGIGQKPPKIAEAGFYYLGLSDETRCFYCDGQLKGWEAKDDPWVKHAKKFPCCQFVIMLKGRCFVREAQTKSEDDGHIAERFMHKEPAISALNMGIEYNDVREAFANQIKKHGRVFIVLHELVESVRDIARKRLSQLEEIREDLQNTTSPSHAAKADLVKEVVSSFENDINILCKVCMQNRVSIVILPCAHLSSCEKCSIFLRKCPICRSNFKGYVRAFLS